MQFAHRNLVVHRDIKAANILVTGDGTPKLLDFGIAKLLAPESLSHTLPVTRLQERILTPENAAPEQVLGRPITTATDIYALGVLLYQSLTGRSPYRLLSYSQLQLERAICMDEPLRPSQMVVAKLGAETDADRSLISERRGFSPPRLRTRLSRRPGRHRGDGDAQRAGPALSIRRSTRRRFESTSAGPARAGTSGRLALQHARNSCASTCWPCSASAVAFLGLAVIAGVTLWQNHRIELAREATAQERDRAQQVSAFLVDVFSQADPFNAQGHEPTARELLDRGAAKIMGNQSLQPEVRAQLLESIGLAYRRQGLSERAIPLVRAGRGHPPRGASARQPPHCRGARESGPRLTDGGNLVSAEGYLQQALELSRRRRSLALGRDRRHLGAIRAIRAKCEKRARTRGQALRRSSRHLSQRTGKPASVGGGDPKRSRLGGAMDG